MEFYEIDKWFNCVKTLKHDIPLFWRENFWNNISQVVDHIRSFSRRRDSFMIVRFNGEEINIESTSIKENPYANNVSVSTVVDWIPLFLYKPSKQDLETWAQFCIGKLSETKVQCFNAKKCVKSQEPCFKDSDITKLIRWLRIKNVSESTRNMKCVSTQLVDKETLKEENAYGEVYVGTSRWYNAGSIKGFNKYLVVNEVYDDIYEKNGVVLDEDGWIDHAKNEWFKTFVGFSVKDTPQKQYNGKAQNIRDYERIAPNHKEFIFSTYIDFNKYVYYRGTNTEEEAVKIALSQQKELFDKFPIEEYFDIISRNEYEIKPKVNLRFVNIDNWYVNKDLAYDHWSKGKRVPHLSIPATFSREVENIIEKNSSQVAELLDVMDANCIINFIRIFYVAKTRKGSDILNERLEEPRELIYPKFPTRLNSAMITFTEVYVPTGKDVI